MAKQKNQSLEDKQFFSMFKLLKVCTEDESDFNRIFGYTLFDALSNYKAPDCNLSDEQLKFEEIKTVYGVLKNNIQKCIDKGARQISLELMPVEDIMTKYVKGEFSPESKLLENIVNSNSFKRSEKNFSAYIEAKSAKAYRLALDKGEFKGNRNILLNDYETIINSFS